MSSSQSQRASATPNAAGRTQVTSRNVIEGRGTIKAVPSATSVVIVGKPQGGPPPEMTVLFEGLDSPRFRAGGVTNATAYVLREILRKFCIGKTCSFYTDNDIPGVCTHVPLSACTYS